MKDLLKRYLVFTGGLYLLAFGIVLILRSALGTTPISSVNYVMSLHTPLTLGACTFLFNMLLIAGQFCFVGRRRTRRLTVEILLQIPFSFLFGAFIDLNMLLTERLIPDGYAASLGLLAVGCFVQSAGVVLEIRPRVAMMSAEGFVYYAAQRCGREFGRCKVCFDVALVLLAALLSLLLGGRIEGIREGTVAAACVTGYIVTLLNRYLFTRAVLHRIPLLGRL